MPVRAAFMFRRFLLASVILGAGFAPAVSYAQTRVPVVAPWQVQFSGQGQEPADMVRQERRDVGTSYPQPSNRSVPHAATQDQALAYRHDIETPTVDAKPSAIEVMYSDRIVEELEQYGYSMFEQAVASETATNNNRIPAGAVADDFVLSHQDELEVIFTGQRNDRGTYRVNSEGLLIIRDFPPIPAAGRTIGQVREAIQLAIDGQYNINAHVSLASVRQIDVLIVGHAKKPGRKTLTVFHTVLDALIEAGGIDKTGSLRQIKLVRGGRSIMIDLYALMMHGSTNVDLKLRDGDRIIIPAIGPTVAVAGEVKRPAVYEILPELRGMQHQPLQRSKKISLNDMLDLGGGVLAPGDNRFLKLGMSRKGQEIVKDVSDPFLPEFGDGSILMVSKGEARRYGTVEISGHTRKPGMHALSENATLGSLFDSEDILGSNIYPLMGLVERWDSETLAPVTFDFPLRLVLKGEYDQRLQDGDRITLFSNDQIKGMQRGYGDYAQSVSYEQGARTEGLDDPRVLAPDVAAYLAERSVFVRGAVRYPGAYPVSEGATLDMALAVAGGLTLEANVTNIEVTTALNGDGAQAPGGAGTRRLSVNFRETSPQEVAIEPGDSVRVNQKFNKIADHSVLIMGEVVNPGRYDLMPGDTVSSLLTRAGGVTEQAYADGAIFSRASERRAEEARFRAQARVLRSAVAGALQAHEDEKNPQVNAAQIAEARGLAAELEEIEGVGRITVEADPAVLASKPELDMLLETGDRLFIPKRSLTVRVSGEVLSPAALQFRESKKPLEYIHESGGFTFHADKDRAFVLYPDGSAQPLQVSSWNYNPIFIPPGSTIVVPRDPKPFDFVESFKDVSQILSNLAVTAIFIDDVRDD